MISVLSKRWTALLAIGGMAISPAILTAPAQANGACASGLLISTIATSGGAGYQCSLDGLTYVFSSDIVELNTTPMPGDPYPMVNFEASGSTQKISFVNLKYMGNVVFSYKVSSLTDDILPYSDSVATVLQEYTQDPANAEAPTINIVKSSKVLPEMAPTEVTFEPNYAPAGLGDPDANVATLTSLTNTIRKTPGPLPIAGAGFAFALSRKLRHRIKQSA